MPYVVRTLPNLTFTTSQTTSNTIVDLDDASTICLFFNSTTTATNALTVQVALTTASGATFAPLAFPSSGLSNQTITTSSIQTIANIGFYQLNLTATGGPTAARWKRWVWSGRRS